MPFLENIAFQREFQAWIKFGMAAHEWVCGKRASSKIYQPMWGISLLWDAHVLAKRMSKCGFCTMLSREGGYWSLNG